MSCDFIENFPVMCSKYRCDQVPVVQEIFQDNSSTSVFKEEVLTNAPTNFGGSANKKYKQRKLYRSPAHSHNRNKKMHNFPYILALFKFSNNQKILLNLCLNSLKMDILFMLALLDAIRHEKHLLRLDITRCKASSNVVFALRKLLNISNITELNLDNSFLPQINCTNILLGNNALKSLSLCFCYINDSGVRRIAKQIQYASNKHLELLNLSSNLITDEGVKYLAESLRSNRCLKCLILANNKIGDDGCCDICLVLKNFPLSPLEIACKNKRNNGFLIKRQDWFEEYITMKLCKVTTIRGAFNKSNESLDWICSKPFCSKSDVAATMVLTTGSTCMDLILCIDEFIEQRLGENNFPFRFSELFRKNDNIYCKGNNRLAELNLAFNDIGPVGIRRLTSVVHYQKKYERKGLEKVVLEGNPNVLDQSEFHVLSQML